MSGKSIEITVVVQNVPDREAANEAIVNVRAALHASGMRNLVVYVNNPHEPNTGPWD